MLRHESESDAISCAVCAKAAKAKVWDVPLCPKCCADWFVMVPDSGIAEHQAACAEMRKRTAAFVASKKRVAA